MPPVGTATLVSICPFPIEERKPGLIPGFYLVPAAKSPDKPETLVIQDTYYFFDVPVVHRRLKIDVAAHQVAESVVNDAINSFTGVSEESKPGLFWLMGVVKASDVVTAHAAKLATAKSQQTNWFREQVKLADDDWAQFHRHVFISDVQRHAAKVLGLEREWLINLPMPEENITNCPACFSPVHPQAAICATCGTIIDEKKAAQFKKAKA